MRARYPDRDGYIERNGARVYYEVYENEGPTILLAPTWQAAYSRNWKMQIPYLSRHFRVVTYDAVGNGESDRSLNPERYMMSERVADAIAVLDETDTEKCVAAGLSAGGAFVTVLAAVHPERFDGIIPIAPAHLRSVPTAELAYGWEHLTDEVSDPKDWEKYNINHWRDDWADFVEFFFDQCTSQPHSTKLYDDLVGWAMETTGEVIALTSTPPPSYEMEWLAERIRAITCPSLTIQGSGDLLFEVENGEALAKDLGGELVVLEGADHIPIGRQPVKVNHLIRDFVERVYRIQRPQHAWHVGSSRSKKALYVSSPIGLGHVRRDVAIAEELRQIHPDLQIDWLAQDPVTRVLDANGETIHPASHHLANESGHIEDESGEHDLNAFQAIRNMDEIMASNFMLFDEVVAGGQYDVVIGDETWEIDYHLHENPNLKKTSYVWMTDFVGWVPMPSGGDREAFVAADYNAEMIEHIARYKRIRDKAVFVGNPDDIIAGTFGPDLPLIREWTEANYDFAGYVTGFDPAALGERDELRAELGYHPDEKVCIVTVGGSGVGRNLIERVVDGYPAARRKVSGLRMIVVTGPRLDPDSLPQVEGVEYRSYVDRLYRHLAVADLAIVQAGLTTTMELAAAKVPFIHLPLRNHFEQNFHVPARLERYGAGRQMDYDDANPDHLASVIAEEIGRKVDYMDVETDGAAKAAAMIAELI
ncbi:MAG: alpha/beta fold hydrolase [Actinomycetota bacterium]|nr:alpha/beta fold hydrolase [Actinomycetota bacterium]